MRTSRQLSSDSTLILRDEIVEPHGLDEFLTRLWRSNALLAIDREQEALEAIDEIIAESLKRGFSDFMHVGEITRGQMLLQLGRLEDASVMLDGRFDRHGPPVVTVMDASGVVALGRLALHTGNARQVRQTSEIAGRMLTESTPGVRRHAAWLLSLQATADGDPTRAHQCLCAMGERERRHVLSRLWPDLADEPQMVRIALAVGDRELAESAVADADRRVELSPEVPSLNAIAAHARALLDGDIDELSEAVSLFERSPRSLALAAACEDLGLAHQRAAGPQTRRSTLSPRLWSCLRGPGRPRMRRDYEAACERWGFAAGWRQLRSRLQDGRR